MKKSLIILIVCAVFSLLCCWAFFFFKVDLGDVSYPSDWDTHVVSSIDDDIQADSMRCWTFQLVWNDMVNEVVKQDVVFNPQLKEVENLNKQTFTKDQLSEDSYYTKFWLMTKDIKKEIENWIDERFDETSDILDQFNRDNVPQSDSDYDWTSQKEYFFYAMLKKVFEFPTVFDKLEKWSFNNRYENIKYFWIDKKSKSKLRSQVAVLYYNDDSDFAVSLRTKEWESVILSRGTNKKSFLESYNAILKKAEKYDWDKSFWSHDYLKVPNLNVDVERKYEEFKNKPFLAADWDSCEISQAVQTIQFELDEKWWKIKSEAAISLTKSAAVMPTKQPEPRYFYFDKPFMIFLKEADKEIPYYAAQVSNITLFQK